MPTFDRHGAKLKPGDLIVPVFRITPGFAGNNYNSLMMYVDELEDDQFSYYRPDTGAISQSIFHMDTYTLQVIPRNVAKQGMDAITFCLKLGGLEWKPRQQEFLSTDHIRILENYEEQYRTLSSHS